MSRQLAISSALSIMAMAAMVLFGSAPSPSGAFAPSITISAPHLPDAGTVLLGN